MIAPQTARTQRRLERVVERSPGIKQWAYRGQPLYTYVHESKGRAVTGSDVPGLAQRVHAACAAAAG